MSDKGIWLPSSEMHVSVKDGEVEVRELMTMTLKPLKAPRTGFGGGENEK